MRIIAIGVKMRITKKYENLKKDEKMNEESADGNAEKDDDDDEDRQLKNKRVAGSHQAAAEGEEHKNRNLASIRENHGILGKKSLRGKKNFGSNEYSIPPHPQKIIFIVLLAFGFM